MVKKTTQKNYIFIDTDVFLNTIVGNSSNDSLEKLSTELNKKKIFLILPEVIIKEIKKEFDNWKIDFFKKTEENLTTKKILGIQEQLTDKPKKNNPTEITNIDLIDGLLKEKRNNLFLELREFYENLSKKFNLILENKNTKIIPLTDKLVLSGIKRSLLKKAPCTRSDKTKENAHTKDIDCIAFESLVSFLNKEKGSKNNLFLCVKDSDYRQSSGELCFDISEDLKKFNLKDYKTIESMLSDLSGCDVQIVKTEAEVLTLDSPSPMIEGSQFVTEQNLLELN